MQCRQSCGDHRGKPGNRGSGGAGLSQARGHRLRFWRRQLSRIDGACRRVRRKRGGVRCDVAHGPSLHGAIEAVHGAMGALDVLINNAGMIEPIARLADADPLAWVGALDVNLRACFTACMRRIPVMRAQGAGTILTVSSGAAHSPLEGWSAYCASKAGAAMLTRAAHLEELPMGCGSWACRREPWPPICR